MTALLSRSNPKLQKCSKYGYLSAGLMLQPKTASGIIDVCRFSTGCADVCLDISGHGAIVKNGEFTNSVQEARYNRTQLFRFARAEFIDQLKAEIALHRIYALNEGLQPIVRLNTFSDLLWEKIAPELFTEFSSVQFYDYTKYPLRYRKNLPSNYHLTFSRAETSDNQAEAQRWLDANKPISVVFDTKKGEDLPETFLGHTVVDADLHDVTFLHATKGLVLGLRAKGKAKTDTSGFVVRTNQWSL
jgi:hypothetical protein